MRYGFLIIYYFLNIFSLYIYIENNDKHLMNIKHNETFAAVDEKEIPKTEITLKSNDNSYNSAKQVR